MRHLSPDELLLYAEGELDDSWLCRHVPECVDCKAQLVDLQETYILTAKAIRSAGPDPVPQPLQLERLRTRLTATSELLAAHLSMEDLLLVADGESAGSVKAHLEACTACQDRSADLHVMLAEIECELDRQQSFELPASRRAAALAALRQRLEQEMERQAAPRWSWLPRFELPRIPAMASYASAFAVACLVAWVGWNAVPLADPVPETGGQVAARLAPPPAVAGEIQVPVQEIAARSESPSSRQPERFAWTAASVPAPGRPAPGLTVLLPAPRVELPVPLPAILALSLPSVTDLPPPPSGSEARAVEHLAVPVPRRAVPAFPDDPEALVAGHWMLAQSGLWRESLRAGGSADEVRITGFVDSDLERAEAERKLRAVASGRPVSFAIAVRPGSQFPLPGAARAAVPVERASGGTVRTALLQHYEDAARRTFLPLDRGLLEAELDRYVSSVMRHETELLAHVHALHGLLNHPGIEAESGSREFRELTRFHLEGVSRHETGIYTQLSEALPRRYWAHRGPNERGPADTGGLGAAGRALLADALALDRTLTAMFFVTGEPLDARAANRSSAELLSRIRKNARRLRVALK